MILQPLLLLWLLFGFIASVEAKISYLGYKPKGMNPTLYDPKDDPIVQLDQNTFTDTVFCSTRANCSAFIVEFYSDWCGHCRDYSSIYKAVARDVKDWNKVVTIAAINCADPTNSDVCRDNEIYWYPAIKYFPRNARSVENSSKIRAEMSVAEMRDQITTTVLTDYAKNRYPDWPKFTFLPYVATYTELWRDVPKEINMLAIVFENSPQSPIGAQLLMDLMKYNNRLFGRRSLSDHPLAKAHHILDFPTLTVFKRGEKSPVLKAELRRLLMNEIDEFVGHEQKDENSEVSIGAVKHNFCTEHPEICQAMFYVSELDMLKAVRYALLQEVTRMGDHFSGDNLTAIITFYDDLIQNFPTVSTGLIPNAADVDQNNETITLRLVPLNKSVDAVDVFEHMKQWLESAAENDSISIVDYENEFKKSEKANGSPFPIGEEWEHCLGTNPQFRGYTCGLWTLFHAMTVQAYIKGVNDAKFNPLLVIGGMRGWVDHFFGCRHCRNHFMKMTGRTFKVEDHIHRPVDVFIYLWRAHNIVNARLKGRDTEDPRFPKIQFPAAFLCPSCRNANNAFVESTVQEFLLRYYTSIKPFRKQ